MSKRAVFDTVLNHLYLAEEALMAHGADGATEAYILLVKTITEYEDELYHAAMEEQADVELAAERG